MNQPRSIYQTDYSPHSWFENNFRSTNDEFCSSDNIDDCLKYLSRELSALGYPSIYSSPSSCPFAVNCDIVKLLNVIFELLRDSKEHAEIREELEDRKQRLLSDVNALNKKNAQVKERLEQTERKYNSALERERQLTNKNNHLQQLLKSEKDESKKLSSQIQQQKITYQHEIRKYESRLNQMKSRLNQILADKNPDKKIASISTSHLLQRNSNQRGKWKTGSAAQSSTEELYSSVVSNYENRCQAAVNEIDQYQCCLEDVELQILEIISLVEGDSYKKSFPPLNAVLNGADVKQGLRERFGLMLSKMKEIVVNKFSENKNFLEEVLSLKVKLSENVNWAKCEESDSNEKSPDLDCVKLNKDCKQESLNYKVQKELYDDNKENFEREKSCKEKEALCHTLAQIKEEKSKLEIQKLEMIKVAMKQKSPLYPHGSKSMPSFSIVTTKEGLTSVPVTHQLKQCLSSPNELVRSMSPLWAANIMKSEQNSTASSPVSYNDSLDLISSDKPRNNCANNELPKWARAAIDIPTSDHNLQVEESIVLPDESSFILAHDSSNEELKVPELQSSEEDTLAKLRAAIDDIESRRNNRLVK